MSVGRRIEISARWIIPVDQPPIENGWLSLAAGGTIAGVGHRPIWSDSDRSELGDVAVLPALINAHTHLEFSDLAQPLGHAGTPISKWIGRVVRHRRERAEQSGGHAPAGRRRLAVAKGIAQSIQHGVPILGEIATDPWDASLFDATLRTVVFRELLGQDPTQQAALQDTARAHLDTASQADPNVRWQAGLSPHAPYTVRPELVEFVVGLSADRRIPIAMHLAESAEEMELLAHHRGGLVDRLRELDAWEPSALVGVRTPRDYLELLADAHRGLVIHGNFLTADDHRFLATRKNLHVVFCPRTHDFFGHPRYPLPEMLDGGVQVAIGTDSRASNPDLSIIEELRFISRVYPELPGATILQLATQNGAAALGCDDLFGTLTVGKQGAYSCFRLPDVRLSDPYAALLR